MQRKSGNPFAHKAKRSNKPQVAGKRVGKSKPGKANNQRNRIIKEARGSYLISDGKFVAERK